MQVGAAIKHAVAAALFKVTHSLRFEYSQGDYLTKTLGTPTTSNVWTWSGWVKLNSYTYNNYLFSAGNNTTDEGYIYIHGATKEVRVASRDLGTLNVKRYAQALAQDPGEWIHIVVQGSSNSAEMWIDGQQQTSWSTTTTNSTTWSINSAVNHGIGVRVGQSGTGPYLDGQLAEVHFVDGTAYDASYFGETRGGQWVPKEVTGLTYGNNGFYLPFDRREEGVTLLLDGSGGGTSTITDNSSVGTTVNNEPDAANGVQNSNMTGPYGSSMDVLSFDGTDDRLEFDVSTALQLSGDFTIETWMRRSNNASRDCVITYWGNSGNPRFRIEFEKTTDNLTFYDGTSDLNFSYASTNADINDTWFHLAVTRSGSTYEVFVDGTSLGTQTGATTTFTGNASESNKGHIGSLTGTADFFGGQMADFRITRGIARDIAADWTNGVYTSALTNDIQYGSLGRDASTNSNNFTVPANTLTPDDQLIDSPNLRFATWDAGHKDAAVTLTDANLTISAAYRGTQRGTELMTAGKWYWETLVSSTPQYGVAIVDPSFTLDADLALAQSGSKGVGYWTGGQLYDESGLVSSTGASYTTGDVVAIAVDFDSAQKSAKFYKAVNGSLVLQYTYNFGGSNLAFSSGAYPAWNHSGTSVTQTATVNFGQDHTFAGALAPLSSPFTDSAGNGEFYYQPPTGFKALATSY